MDESAPEGPVPIIAPACAVTSTVWLTHLLQMVTVELLKTETVWPKNSPKQKQLTEICAENTNFLLSRFMTHGLPGFACKHCSVQNHTTATDVKDSQTLG